MEKTILEQNETNEILKRLLTKNPNSLIYVIGDDNAIAFVENMHNSNFPLYLAKIDDNNHLVLDKSKLGRNIELEECYIDMQENYPESFLKLSYKCFYSHKQRNVDEIIELIKDVLWNRTFDVIIEIMTLRYDNSRDTLMVYDSNINEYISFISHHNDFHPKDVLEDLKEFDCNLVDEKPPAYL